ncbi:MAG TPA: HPr family phosphocarrier protein [Hydrogenispora sp.]|jgi:phosphotransferase system HPr (HPr) family protein|nr:HPr family phosphocarrier protein [Hydrogenispora sp.]
MVKKMVTIKNKSGLHARPAAVFMEKAQEFASQIYLARPGEEPVNGKSILGILTLGVEKGSTIEIAAEGPDAEEAVAALADLVESFEADL